MIRIAGQCLLASALGAVVAAPCLSQSADRTGSVAGTSGGSEVDLNTGYNLVGWTADTADVLGATSDIADSFSDLRSYDYATDTYLRYRDGATAGLNTLSDVPYGAGLWILADGELNWGLRPEAPSATVALKAGQNLVAWLGADATPIETAVATLGEALVSVHAWDTDLGSFKVFAPAAPASLQDDIVLRYGDGLWVNVAWPVDWAQTLPGEDAIHATVEENGALLVHSSGASLDIPPDVLPAGTPVALYSVPLPTNVPPAVTIFGDTFGVAAGARPESLATIRVPLGELPPETDPEDVVLFRFGAENFPQEIGGFIDGDEIVATLSSFSKVVAGLRNGVVTIVGPTVVAGDRLFRTYVAADFLAGRPERDENFNRTAFFHWTLDPRAGGIFASRQQSFFNGRPRIEVDFEPPPAEGTGIIKVEARDGMLSASDMIVVQLDQTAFSISSDFQLANGTQDPPALGEDVTFFVHMTNGQAPYDVRFIFEDRDVLVEDAEFSVSSTTRSFETPGSKFVTIEVTDFNGQFATTRTSVNVEGSLTATLTGPERVVLGETARYDLDIQGAAPSIEVEATAVGIGLENIGQSAPEPLVGPIGQIEDLGQATIKWTPDAPGSYLLSIRVMDGLSREVRRSTTVRVKELRAEITSSATDISTDTQTNVSITITGGTAPYDIELFDDRGDVTESLVSDEAAFSLPVVFSKPGAHELTVKVQSGNDKARATVPVRVVEAPLLGERTWVRIASQFNPDGLPLRTESGSFTRTTTECQLLGEGSLKHRRTSENTSSGEVVSDVTWTGHFDVPPEQVAPLETLALDFTVMTTGFSNGGSSLNIPSTYTHDGDGGGGQTLFLKTCALRNPPCQEDGQDAPRFANGLAQIRLTGRFGDVEALGTQRILTAAVSGGACTLRWTYELMGPQP